MDESGFYLLPARVRTYAPRGQTPILRVYQTRDHLSIMSGITLEGNLFTLTRYEAMAGTDSVHFLKHLRVKHLKRRRLPIVAALALIVPLIFYVQVPDTAGVFAATVLSFLKILIIISPAMFAGDAVCGEFEKKTSLLLFPTPQRRSTIFAGKYLAALLATFFAVILYYLVMTLQIAQLYGWGQIPTELAKSFLTALVYSARL